LAELAAANTADIAAARAEGLAPSLIDRLKVVDVYLCIYYRNSRQNLVRGS
jgi:gamma-glutamyl phosphate reductase